VHTGLCAFQSVRWHSREQYRTARHREHMLLASFDAHPAAAHKAFATHSAFSDSSFPSSRETAYRPVRASNDSTIDGISISMSLLALQLPDLCAPATDKVLLQ
jgi:hypothetical protein